MKKRELWSTYFGKWFQLITILLASSVFLLASVSCDDEEESPSITFYPPFSSTAARTPPTVETLAATNITATGATLNGRVISMGSATSVGPYFEYGLATSYGSVRSAGDLSGVGNFAAVISGLLPNTTYHFRALLTPDALVPGIDLTFTTLPPPPVLSLANAILPMGIVGEVYTTDIRPTGGSLPYSFSLSSGVLPTGLRLTSLSDRCRIEGTPTEYGEYTFAITVRDSITATAVNATIKLTVAPNLNGKWMFNTTVTAAGGVCSEEVGHTSSRIITIVQTGLSVTLSGFLGNPTIQLSGSISVPSSVSGGGKWVIIVAGSYPEDGGTTTSTRTLTLNTSSTMSGDEVWEWIGSGGSCPGGKATLTTYKIP